MAHQWDEQKRRSNLQRHGMDFRDAHLAFNKSALVFADDRYEYGEERYILYGLIGTQIVTIAFTYRGESVRIISMRKASGKEQLEYVQNRLGTNPTDDR